MTPTANTMTNHEIWQAVLAEFELNVSKANFTTWFQNTGLGSYDTGKVMICVPSAFINFRLSILFLILTQFSKNVKGI